MTVPETLATSESMSIGVTGEEAAGSWGGGAGRSAATRTPSRREMNERRPQRAPKARSGCRRRASERLVVRLSRCGRMSVAARRYDPRMRYGIALPNFTDVASPEGIEAAAEVAERLGWDASGRPTTSSSTHDASPTTARIYEAIVTLAWVGARHPTLRLGTSVIVVPQRNAVVLAKELATLDALSGGRVDRRRRHRLERGRVRQPRAGRPVRASAAPTSTRRSRCGATCGPARPSRSTAGSTASTTSRSSRCRRRASGSRSGRGADAAPRSSGSAASAMATTRAPLARRRTPSGSRRSAPPPRPPAGRCRRCRPGSASSPARRRQGPSTTRCAARPTRSPPRSERTPSLASRISRSGSTSARPTRSSRRRAVRGEVAPLV